MCKGIWLVLAALFATLGIQEASATRLDFRGSSWNTDNESLFYNLPGPIDVTVRAIGGDLSWDSRDGYGVEGDVRGSYEDDEIEGPERLVLTFTQAVTLSAIWISDLFIEHGYTETGWYSLNDGPRNPFSAVQPTGTNGSLIISNIPNLLVTSITFGAPGHGQEFALTQLEFCPGGTPVPEPASCALLGAGLLGGILRRRASRAAV